MHTTVLLVLMLASGKSGAQTIQADTQAIHVIEVHRLAPESLASYATAESPLVRARAARALGRLGDSGAMDWLVPLASDESVEVRTEAAFALGLTPGASRAIHTLLSSEELPEIRALLAQGLGRQGDESVVDALLELLEEDPVFLQPALVSSSASAALARLGMRDVEGAATPDVGRALVRQLDRLDRSARRSAAYALARLGVEGLASESRVSLLERAVRDPDPDIRAWLLRATSALVLSEAEREALFGVTSVDHDRGVRIATARATKGNSWVGIARLMDDPALDVRLEVIAAIGHIEALEQSILLTPLLSDANPLVVAAAVRALGEAGLLEDGAIYRDQAQPTPVRVAATESCRDSEILERLALEDDVPAVRTTAAAQLLESEAMGSGSRRAFALVLLDASDPMVQASAAGWLSENPDRRAERPLLDAVEQSSDADFQRAAAQALSSMYGGSRPLVRPGKRARKILGGLAQHGDPSIRVAVGPAAERARIEVEPPVHQTVVAPLEQVEHIRSARIFTERGEVVVELYSEVAPATVWSFATLAEQGFYDGLPIHRVVPDFVLQHGDPRADSWGGAGYTLPDELSPLPYRTGTLGMARDGPDTAGSQWFVTLSPQPHLEGSYTVFGQVQRGTRILHELRLGDTIQRIQIERIP
ncbi:MAG: peptidylprolyl isomerase [Myxococcota bacterium]|nr:peptidylprolyl isomerase [Myxococcota bacterium]